MMMLFNRMSRLELIQAFCLAGVFLFISIKISVSFVFVVSIFLLELLKRDLKGSLLKVKSHSMVFSVLAFFSLFPLSYLWSSNTAWSLEMARYFWPLGLLPFIVLAVKYQNVRFYLSCFLYFMFFLEVLSYLTWFDIILFPGVLGFNPYDPTPFTTHIIYNPFLAFAIYILLDRMLFDYKQLSIAERFVYLFFVLTMTVNMLITGGRIGQIAFFVLMLLFFYQLSAWFPKRKSLILLIGFFALMLVVGFAFEFSSIFHERMYLMLTQLHLFFSDDGVSASANSVGGRLYMWIQSWQIFLQNPVVGTGVGDFIDVYNKQVGFSNSPMPMKPYSEHVQPHNQYLYVLATFGLIGALVFLYMLVKLGWLAFSCHDRYRYVRVAFVTLTLVVMMTDSYLLVPAFEAFFVFIVAVLFSGDHLYASTESKNF